MRFVTFLVACVALSMAILWPNPAVARPQYFAELTTLLNGETDERVKTVAKELRCRVCHTTEPPRREHNAFGKEVASVLGEDRNVTDTRSIQMALHRAVFRLKNQTPDDNQPARRRYVGTVLKENVELAAYEMPLSDVLDVLSNNYEIEIETDAAAIKRARLSMEKPVSLVISQVPLKSLLKFMLSDYQLDYQISGNKLLVVPAAITNDTPKDRTPRAVVRRRKDEIDPALEGKLKKRIGVSLTITNKSGDRFSGRLLKLHTKDGKLEALSVYSARSTSRQRYVDLNTVTEIRTRTGELFERASEKDPVVIESRRLEKEVLIREAARKRERLQESYRRQAGLERAAESLRGENGRFSLGRQYEAQLGSASEIVEALGELAVNQVTETRPRTPNPVTESNPTPSPGTSTPPVASPSNPTPESPAASDANSLPSKTVVMKYQTMNGQPPTLRYGTRIRYETADPNDPQMQQADLDDKGECQLQVPIDVRTIRVYTTPFGGSEGTHRLNAEGETSVLIRIEGGE